MSQQQVPTYTYSEIFSSGTTTLKSGPGHLKAIVVNSRDADDTLQIFDSTAASGTTIAGHGGPFSLTAVGTLGYDCDFYTGLTVVTANFNAPSSITVVWS